MVTSGGRSSSTVRRISPRRVASLVMRRRDSVAGPLSPPVLRRAVRAPLSSPPVLRRAVPTSLHLPTTTRNLPTVSSITVSLPRSFASELVAASRENVAAAAADTAVVGYSESTMAGDDVTSLPAGLSLSQFIAFTSFSKKKRLHLL